MKRSNLSIKENFKSIVGTLFVVAVLFVGVAAAQETKEVYFGKQVAALTKQIAAAPKNDKLYVERARAYQELAKFAEALADADKALQINPKNAEAVKLRAALKAKNSSESSELNDNPFKDLDFDFYFDSPPLDDKKTLDLNTRLAADPKNSDLYVERGELYLKEKKLAEAFADAEKALQIRPSNSYAMLLRSVIKAAKNDRAGSDADFREAVKLRGESNIVGRIVSHSGQTLTGIVVKGKIIGNADGYSSIDEVKKDLIGIYTKVLIQNVKTKRITVYEGTVALDSEKNVVAAETQFQPKLYKEDGILAGYQYMKIATDQSLLLPKIDRAAAALDFYVLDILDTSNLSLVRRQMLPLPKGGDALGNLMDSEIKTFHTDEAKEVYLYFDKISAKAADQNEVKLKRKQYLKMLYVGEPKLWKFVEQEMEKHRYTDEEKKSVKNQKIYV